MTTQWVSLKNSMSLTYKDIAIVRFPVYAVSSANWYGQDGLLFLENKILDDKNMRGNSLGIRRLQTPHKNLYPLKHQLDDLRGIIKSNKKTFVDSNGAVFTYTKTEFSQLKYYKIKDIVQKGTCSLLKLYNIKNPFIIPRPPHTDMKYAGVLHYNGLPWVLYDYAEEKLKDTRRKI